MAEPITPSEEELEALTNPVLSPPGEDPKEGPMPNPEPEVLERAQAIIDKTGETGTFSQISEGTESAERYITEPIKSISNEQKLRFLAHALGGKEFRETYSAFDGHFVAIFRTLTPQEELILGELVASDENIPKARRRIHYTRYAMAVALESLQISGETIKAQLDCRSSRFKTEFEAWFKSLSGLQYKLLYSSYEAFQKLVDELLQKAYTPDFWPTPSSP